MHSRHVRRVRYRTPDPRVAGLGRQRRGDGHERQPLDARSASASGQPADGRRRAGRRADRRPGDRVHGELEVHRHPVRARVGLALSLNIGFITGLIPFDPYPFILLNLAFSTQAAYAAPLILLASNRTTQQDRLTLEHAADEADLEEKQNDELLRGNTEILKRVVALEEHILSLEQTIVGLLKAGPDQAPER